jgi:hypothetical protein
MIRYPGISQCSIVDSKRFSPKETISTGLQIKKDYLIPKMITPKTKTIIPAIRLIQVFHVVSKRSLNKPTKNDKVNHQLAEPRKTPKTRTPAER